MTEEHDEKIKRMCQNVTEDLIPIGYLDLKSACETFHAYGLTSQDLSDAIHDFMSNTGMSLEEIDVCYIAYDHILNHARNHIQESIGFDIVDDVTTEVSVYGNYMCTDFQYTEQTVEEIKKAIEKANADQCCDLFKDCITKQFLIEIEVLKEV